MSRSGSPHLLIFLATLGGPLLAAEPARFENPSRVKTIHAVLLSHLDIGFTATAGAVATGQKDSLDAAVRLVRERTDFTWTIESVWQLEEWLKRTEDPAEVDGLASLIRSGRIALGALPGNLHTGVFPAELLSRATYPAARLRRRFAVPAEVAIQDDVPGFSWALPRSLAGAGIRYLLLGVNTSFGGGGGIRPGANAFWWEAPDGGRVLTWVATGSYVEAERWGFGLWAQEDEAEKHMAERLGELARAGFPDEDYLVMAALGDNVPAAASRSVLDRIGRWNDRHESPKIRVSHPAEFFHRLEERRGTALPVLRGDFSGWWENMKATAPFATSEFRRAGALFPAAEALAALARLHGQSPYPRFDFLALERGLLEYGEHTGEATCGWPELTTREEILRENQEHVEQASAAAARVSVALERGLDRLADRLSIGKPAVLVLNPLGQFRAGEVTVPVPASFRQKRFLLLETGSNCPLPHSLEGASGVRFECPQIPPFGYRVIAFVEGQGPSPVREAASPSPPWLLAGGQGLGEAYLAAGNSTAIAGRRDAGKRIPSPGPLRSRTYRAVGEDEVEVGLEIDGDALKAMEVDSESSTVFVDFDLAFDPREARLRVEGPGLWFEPDRDRLGDAVPAPSAAGRSFAVTGKEGVVLIAPLEAPLVQFIRGEKSVIVRSIAWMRSRRGKPRLAGDGRFDRVEPTDSALRRFTYRIRFTREPFDPVPATRFAAEAHAPLLARFVVPFFSPPDSPLAKEPVAGGGIGVSPESVVLEAWKLSEPIAGPGDGPPAAAGEKSIEVTARLREISGKPAGFRLSLPARVLSVSRARIDEEPLAADPVEWKGAVIRGALSPNEIATFRIRLESKS